MKTNKNHRPHRPTRPTPPRPAPRHALPPARPVCEFLDFCLYPGMQPEQPRQAYPTAV